MNEEIFRKKSLDKIKSPENLDNYIRVSNPGVWLLLISIVVLLVGACVWGIFGQIDSTIPTTVRIENGSTVCYIDEEEISAVQIGMTVKFADSKAKISQLGEKDESGFVCILTLDSDSSGELSDGLYDGEIVVQSYNPLSFILN